MQEMIVIGLAIAALAYLVFTKVGNMRKKDCGGNCACETKKELSIKKNEI